MANGRFGGELGPGNGGLSGGLLKLGDAAEEQDARHRGGGGAAERDKQPEESRAHGAMIVARDSVQGENGREDEGGQWWGCSLRLICWQRSVARGDVRKAMSRLEVMRGICEAPDQTYSMTLDGE